MFAKDIICRTQQYTSQPDGAGANIQDGTTGSPECGDLYAQLIAVRNQELSLLWTRFNLHLVINGGLLVAVYSTDKVTGLGRKPFSFGVLLTILWLLSELAGRQALRHWDQKLGDFERLYWGSSLGFRLFSNLPCYNLFPIKARNLRHQGWISIAVILVFMVGWVLLLFYPDSLPVSRATSRTLTG